MTFGALTDATLKELGEESGVSGYYTFADVAPALNWAQRLFVLLTLALEDTATVTLDGSTWSHIRAQVPDFFRPLRLENSGAKVRPARLQDLDALDAGWQSRVGVTSRYAVVGQDLFAVYKQSSASLTLIYARSPVRLEDSSASPEIPEEYHSVLSDAATIYCRLKEGGQELAKIQPHFKRFMDGATQYGNYMRTRNLGLRYDTLPPEIARFDLSRLLAIEKKRETPWLMDSRTRPAQAQS